MKKIRVAVLMGGKTPEHEISIISGTEVVKNLDRNKYEVMPVVISKSGKRWQLVPPRSLFAIQNPLKYKETEKELVLAKRELTGTDYLSNKVDVVFIAMHGPFGEDGAIQGMLETAGILYTGTRVLASALGMDKFRFRKVLEAESISIPKYVAIIKGEPRKKIYKKLNIPLFVKPNNQGSSIGASIVKRKSDLKKALDKAFNYSNIALVDEYLDGIEVTCGILGNENPTVLPLVEIVPLQGAFFDYESKYKESGAEEIVPARISVNLTKKVQKIAIEVYKIIGCRGFSRVDFILKNNKYPVVLEINTIPGLTPMSLMPKAAQEKGISYAKLLDKIITHALKK